MKQTSKPTSRSSKPTSRSNSMNTFRLLLFPEKVATIIHTLRKELNIAADKSYKAVVSEHCHRLIGWFVGRD